MYDAPISIEHSTTLKIINFAGSLLKKCGIGLFELDADRILTRAAQETGFPFRNDLVREGLGRLIDSIKADSNLNAFGRFSLRSLLQRSAQSRFLIERTFSEHPEVLEESIEEPVFIIGLPRTGTTILQALLSRDPAHRSPLCWECLLPHPAPTPDNYADNHRIDSIRKELDQIFKLVPDFRTKHYIEADSPQECLAVTALNFTSFQFMVEAYVPKYHAWFFHTADQVENLRWHKRFLQFLQSGGVRERRWLLKSSIHLMRLRALFDVYPDARIIMTHRHPGFVVPSVASLMSSMRSLYSDHEDNLRTGRESLHLWADYFERFLLDRRQLDREDRIIDLMFDDFVDDQMGVVERIYKKFRWSLDGETAARMSSFLEQEQKDKHGRHEYSLEQFGVAPAEIEKRYTGYLEFLHNLDKAPARGFA